MADKDTKLSIIISTVDKATAKIKAINDRLDAVTKPVNDFKKALGELREKSGLDDVIGGFKGVGSAIGDLLGKVAMIGGVVGVAVAGLVHLIDGFDDLGKKAARLGVGVDFLAGMRDAAERTGVPIEALDSSLETFNQNLGAARAGTGRMAKFLGLVSPVLLQQVKAAKSNAEAFDLMAGAMAKITDPAKRAALAQKTFGDAALAPLFAKGPKGIKELRDHYIALAGSQEGAVKSSEATHEALLDMKDATDGVKAALVEGLAPALSVIIKQITEWLQGHRDDIKEWAVSIGEQLPDAFDKVVDAIKGAIGFVEDIVDDFGGVKNVIIGLIAVMLGPLLSAFVTLGVALLTTPFGWFLAGVAAVVLAITELVKHWDDVKGIAEDVLNFMPGAASAEELSDRRSMKAAERRVKMLDADPALQAGRASAQASAAATAAAEGTTVAAKRAAQAVAAGRAKNSDLVNALLDKAAGAPAEDVATQAAIAAARGDVAGQADAAARGAGASKGGATAGADQSSAKITVDFANAPRGTRVTTDPQSTADVDLSVGYQMLGVTQ